MVVNASFATPLVIKQSGESSVKLRVNRPRVLINDIVNFPSAVNSGQANKHRLVGLKLQLLAYIATALVESE